MKTPVSIACYQDEHMDWHVNIINLKGKDYCSYGNMTAVEAAFTATSVIMFNELPKHVTWHPFHMKEVACAEEIRDV